MSLLNMLCVICSDNLKYNDVIYSTRCGHVFHKSCLLQWLNRSRSCPQCRRHCMEHLCHQLFLNFIEAPLVDTKMDVEYPTTYEWICAGNDIDYTSDMSFGFMFGWDDDGCDIYLGRGRLNGNLIPGVYIASENELVVCWGSESHFLTEEIEILDISNDGNAQYNWISASNSNLPEDAFPTGITADGEILYTARVLHNGKEFYGNLHKGKFQAYLPYEDEEVFKSNYEVLVRVAGKMFTNPAALENETEDQTEDLLK